MTSCHQSERRARAAICVALVLLTAFWLRLQEAIAADGPEPSESTEAVAAQPAETQPAEPAPSGPPGPSATGTEQADQASLREVPVPAGAEPVVAQPAAPAEAPVTEAPAAGPEAAPNEQAAPPEPEMAGPTVPVPVEAAAPAEAEPASPSGPPSPEPPAAEPAGASELEAPRRAQPEAPQPSQAEAPPPAELTDAELWKLLQKELPPEPRLEDVRLTFSFRYQPWEKVLNWIADEAGLSLWYETLPQGTCNYTDNKEYTLPQALDVLNGLLMFKGYTLVRRERLLVVAHVDDLGEGGLPPTLWSTVPVEELDKRGEYELITTVFSLEKVTAEEAQAEIKGLVVPPGSVILMPKARQIVVTETAARLRMIRDALQRIEDPGGLKSRQFRSFPLDFTLADDVLAILRQQFDIPAEENAAPDGSIRLILDPMGMRLIAFGEPSKLDQVAQVIEVIQTPTEGAFDAQGPEAPPQLDVYAVAPADPETVKKVVSTLIAGSPGARIDSDPKTGNLIVLARPDEHATIRATLEQLRNDAGTVDVIQLRTLDPQLAVLSITKLFGGEGSSLKVDADVTTRRLVIRGPERVVEQIRTWLDQMGESGTGETSAASGGNVRMLPLSGWAAQSALERALEMWPVMRRNNKIRVVTPSDFIPTLRASERAGALSPEEAYLEQLFGIGTSAAPPGPRQLTPQPSARSQPPAWPSAGDSSTVQPSEPVPSAQSPPVEAAGPQAKSAATGDRHAASRAPVRFASETLAQEPESATASPLPPQPAPVQPPAQPRAEQPSPAQLPAGQAPIIVAPGPGGIMIASEDLEALDEFENLLTALASGALSGTSDLTVFYLVHAKAAAVAETLDPILGGGTLSEGPSGGGSLLGDLAGAAFGDAGALVGSMLGIGGGGGTVAPSGSIQIIPDVRLNALIVRASPSDAETIRQLLEILDQPESPEEVFAQPKPRLIPVVNTQASEIAEVVRQVFQENLTSAGGGGRPPSPQEFIEALRGSRSRGRGSRSSAEDVQKMSIGIDGRTNSLIVSAPQPLFQEVEQLVRTLDEAALGSSNQSIQVVTLKRTNAENVQKALASLVGESVQFGSSSRSSRTSSSSTGGGPPFGGFSPEDMQRRMEFYRALREGGGFGGGPTGGGFGPPGGGSGGRGPSPFGGSRGSSPFGGGRGPSPFGGGRGPSSGGGRGPGR